MSHYGIIAYTFYNWNVVSDTSLGNFVYLDGTWLCDVYGPKPIVHKGYGWKSGALETTGARSLTAQ